MGFFPKRLKSKFETAVVNESLVFEPPKVYTYIHTYIRTYVQFGMVGLGHGAGPGDVWTFFSPIFLSSSLSVCKTARYTLKYCLKGPLNPRQPTTSCLFHCLSVCLPVCMIVCLLVHGCCLSVCFQF